MNIQFNLLSRVKWNEFSLFENIQYEYFYELLNNFLIKNSIIISKSEFHIFFGLLFSEYAFLKYLHKEDIYSSNNNNVKYSKFFFTHSMDNFVDQSWINLSFFHRHAHFEEQFIKSTGIQNYSNIGKRKISKINFISLIREINKHGIFIYGDEIISRLLFIFYNYQKLIEKSSAINLLGSAHGIYSAEGSFLLAKSKRSGGKIFINQPGLIHSQAEYIHQVKYEKKIADKFISWGGTQEYNNNSVDIGCMYSNRESKNNENGTTQVLLPQIPRGLPRPFSFYWSYRSEFDVMLPSLINKIQQIYSSEKNVILRCKDVDASFYQLMIRKEFPQIQLNSGDINAGQEFGFFEKTYVSYFSTGIAEAFYKGSNTQLIFDKQSFSLEKKYEADTSFFVESYTDQSQLKNYLNKYAIFVSPSEFSEKLISVFRSLNEDRQSIV